MKNNVIPRKATKLAITFKKDTSGHKTGDTTIVEKDEFGFWSDGQYRYCVAHLRNPELCTLEVLK